MSSIKGFFVTGLKNLVFKNTAIQVAGYITQLVLGLLTTMILSRYLGVKGFGEFNYVFAFFYFFLSLSDFGLSSILIREISQRPLERERILGAAFSLKFLMGLFYLGVAWLIISYSNFPEDLRKNLFIYALVLPVLSFQMPALIFNVLLRMEYSVIAPLCGKVFGFALLLWGVYSHKEMPTLITFTLIQEILTTALLYFFAQKFISLKMTFDFLLWKKFFASAFFIGFSGLLAACINRVDFIMLERIRGLHEVGLYSANYKVINFMEAFPLMFMNSVYPLMAQFSATDSGRLKKIFIKSSFGLHFAGIFLGVGIFTFAPQIIRFLCGDDFAGAENGLRALVWATVFLYGALTSANLLISWHHEKLNLFFSLAAAVMNILLNALWIPRYGYVGAAAATSIAYGMLWLSTMTAVFILWKRHFKKGATL